MGCRFRRDSLACGAPKKMIPISPYRVVLDMDSTEIPVYGEQEQSAYNGHFESTCYHPVLLFNGGGDCLAAKLRAGNSSIVHRHGLPKNFCCRKIETASSSLMGIHRKSCIPRC